MIPSVLIHLGALNETDARLIVGARKLVVENNPKQRAVDVQPAFLETPCAEDCANHRESYPVRPSRRSDLRKIMRCYLSGDYEGEESPPHPGFTRT